MVTQAFRKVSLAVHPDKKRGNASLLAKLVAAKELVLLEMEEALRRGEDELSKAAGRLKWLKCQCNSCAPLIVKSGNCLGCIREAGIICVVFSARLQADSARQLVPSFCRRSHVMELLKRTASSPGRGRKRRRGLPTASFPSFKPRTGGTS